MGAFDRPWRQDHRQPDRDHGALALIGREQPEQCLQFGATQWSGVRRRFNNGSLQNRCRVRTSPKGYKRIPKNNRYVLAQFDRDGRGAVLFDSAHQGKHVMRSDRAHGTAADVQVSIGLKYAQNFAIVTLCPRFPPRRKPFVADSLESCFAFVEGLGKHFLLRVRRVQALLDECASIARARRAS